MWNVGTISHRHIRGWRYAVLPVLMKRLGISSSWLARDHYSYGAANRIADRFEAMLAQWHVTVLENSALARMIQNVRQSLRGVVQQIDQSDAAMRERWTDIVACTELATLVVQAARRPGARMLAEHLGKLNKIKEIRLDQKAEAIDREANKVLELIVGAVVMGFAINVDVDDPGVSAGGTNPDVIATTGCARWTLRAKCWHL
jgi:hypothetical protein